MVSYERSTVNKEINLNIKKGSVKCINWVLLRMKPSTSFSNQITTDSNKRATMVEQVSEETVIYGDIAYYGTVTIDGQNFNV